MREYLCFCSLLSINYNYIIEPSPEQDKHKQKPRSREESGIGRATPCENQRPAWYAMLYNEREEDPAPRGEGLWRLKGGHWDTGSYVPRQGQMEEACGRPMLHTESRMEGE